MELLQPKLLISSSITVKHHTLQLVCIWLSFFWVGFQGLILIWTSQPFPLMCRANNKHRRKIMIYIQNRGASRWRIQYLPAQKRCLLHLLLQLRDLCLTAHPPVANPLEVADPPVANLSSPAPMPQTLHRSRCHQIKDICRNW